MSDGGIQNDPTLSPYDTLSPWEKFWTWVLPDDGSGSGTGAGNAAGSGNEGSQSWLDNILPPTPNSWAPISGLGIGNANGPGTLQTLAIYGVLAVVGLVILNKVV